jgi:hypothetical protein
MRGSARAYQFCGVTIASDLALAPLRRGALADAECAITTSVSAARAPDSWFHEWRMPGGKLWLSIGRMRAGYVLRFRDQADFVVRADGRRIRVHPAPGLPEDTLRHLLIDQVLPLALSRRGRLSLHASAVHIPTVGTVGFVGVTGRGKSTLAAALAARGGRILTDDCLGIDFIEGVPYALPGYPGLRLWPGQGASGLLRAAASSRVAHYSRKRRVHRGALPFHGRPSRLRALFLLSTRGPGGAPLSLRRCRASAGLMGLLRFAYVLDVEDRQNAAAVFGALATIATSVPVLRLRLPHGHNRLAEAADLIRARASALGPPFGGMLPS